MNEAHLLLCQISHYTGIPITDSKSMEYIVAMMKNHITFTDYFSLLTLVRSDPYYTFGTDVEPLPEDVKGRVDEIMIEAKRMHIHWAV